MEFRINYIYQLNYFWDKVEAENSLKPTSICIYLSLLNINNSCGWKNPFRVAFSQVLSQTGIANTKTYYAGLHELVESGFISWTKSKNQHQAAEFSINVLNQNLVEQGHSKVIASTKQLVEQGHSNSHILKQENNKLINKEINISFDVFWNLYPSKVGKKGCEKIWNGLKDNVREKIIKTLPSFIAYKPFEFYSHPNPLTYLKNDRWDDVIPNQNTQGIKKKVIDHRNT